MKTHNKRSIIELCILALLSKEDYYGYDLSMIISEKINIADGTIYPILRKLKTEGIVKTYLTEGKGGPPRKYYQITVLGKEEYEIEKDGWRAIFNNVIELLEE